MDNDPSVREALSSAIDQHPESGAVWNTVRRQMPFGLKLEGLREMARKLTGSAMGQGGQPGAQTGQMPPPTDPVTGGWQQQQAPAAMPVALDGGAASPVAQANAAGLGMGGSGMGGSGRMQAMMNMMRR